MVRPIKKDAKFRFRVFIAATSPNMWSLGYATMRFSEHLSTVVFNMSRIILTTFVNNHNVSTFISKFNQVKFIIIAIGVHACIGDVTFEAAMLNEPVLTA